MLLQVDSLTAFSPATTFAFTVPGQQNWSLRSVFAQCTRGAGGTPNRAYVLTITNGSLTVTSVGADDAGTDPGTCSVTWASVQAQALGSGSVGVSVAPLPKLQLHPGYVITGTIINSVAGDAWTRANVWFDYVETGAR